MDEAGVKPPDLQKAGRRKILQPTISGNRRAAPLPHAWGFLHADPPFHAPTALHRQVPPFPDPRLDHPMSQRSTWPETRAWARPTYTTAACPFWRFDPHCTAAPGKKSSVWVKNRPKRYCILKIFCYNKNIYPHGVWVSIRLASPLPSASRAHRSQQGPVSALVPLVRILRDTGRLSKTMTAAEPPARCGHSPPFGHMTAAEHRPFTQAAWYHLLHGC